ncbi:MAG TPA: zf-HC2 domain-containing protein, partial [Vicinamibacterales bacterium]|nr:zf-HC2 domain-containing protein [Vicinamibacterales bacterium]
MADAPGVMKRDVRMCPDPETIAAFLDGRLSGRERAQVVEHLADCADCYFIFSESARMPAASAERVGARDLSRALGRWFAQPRVAWPAVAALAAAVAIAVWIPSRSPSSPELQALVAAVGTERTFEPRLTGGFAYGPVRGAVRGSESSRTPSPDVTIAAAHIEKEALARRTSETLRSLGITYLVL